MIKQNFINDKNTRLAIKKIDDYYSEIINDIDIDTETALLNSIRSFKSSKSILNKKRNTLIEKVLRCKKINFEYLNQNPSEVLNCAFNEKFCFYQRPQKRQLIGSLVVIDFYVSNYVIQCLNGKENREETNLTKEVNKLN